MVFKTQGLNVMQVVGTAKLSNNFLGNISAYILTIIRFIFLFFFFDLAEKFEPIHAFGS